MILLPYSVMPSKCSIDKYRLLQVRTDLTYPAGFMDVISIEKSGEKFRLIYDTKGRYVVHRISDKEASFKLLKVSILSYLCLPSCLSLKIDSIIVIALFWNKLPVLQVKKVGMGEKAVPFLTTHDGRTIRYPDPRVGLHDTIVFNIDTGKMTDYVKFDSGGW